MAPAAGLRKSRLSRLSSFALFVLVLCLFLALDRFTKMQALDSMVAGVRYPFIPGFLDFTLVFNTGGAFGIFSNGGMAFVVIAAIVSAVILIYVLALPKHRALEVVALGLICAGAWGNAIDRMVNAGKVTDFIHTLFIEFPVFNIADCAITVGVALMVLLLITSYIRDARKAAA
jgi:signal peptidase II